MVVAVADQPTMRIRKCLPGKPVKDLVVEQVPEPHVGVRACLGRASGVRVWLVVQPLCVWAGVLV